MFNFSPERSRTSGFDIDSYDFSNQSVPGFDYSAGPAPSSGIAAQQHQNGGHPFGDFEGMDWDPAPSVVQHQYRPDLQENQMQDGGHAMELETLGSSQNFGGGVGRLVAHFENKGFNPFDHKAFAPAPPLPPRPMNASLDTGSAVNQERRHTTHVPSANMNSFQAGMNFDPFSYIGDGENGAGSTTPLSPNKVSSPILSPDESWGSFGGLQRVASNHGNKVDMGSSPLSTPALSYGNFADFRSAGIVAASSSGHFGNLDDFMSVGRTRGSIAHSPMPDSHMSSSPMTAASVAQSAMTPNAPILGSTPGFAIWRPPVSVTADAKINRSPPGAFTSTSGPATSSFDACGHIHSNHPKNDQIADQNAWKSSYSNGNRNPAAKGAGFYKPPLPTKPKPNINFGNQFILELNPSEKAKGKAPVKPPRPRASSVLTTPSSEVKQEPATPGPFELLSSSSTPAPPFSISDEKPDSVPLRGQAGARPTREQVPAEAWEQFKSTIRGLYLEERKPLKEVMAIMADKYNFQATPKMYKTRFSQWGFVKNNTEEEVKRLLSMKFQRDAEGKVSEFVRNGRVVNLGTYLKRKGVTEYDLVDFELPANLPAHVRCRTPTPPPAPGYLRSPDLLRAQELVVGNLRKTFLHCRQFEVETDTHIGWPVTMVWGASSSDLLLEANFYFEARDPDQGGEFLMKAFKALELDLRKLSPLGIIELLLGMVNRDPGMMTALCKYLAAYSSTNFERSHPLRQIFTCLYEVQQKHGSTTLSELLGGSMPAVAEELEAIYSRRHPYVARTWIDLALFYKYVDSERFDKLARELRAQQRPLEQRLGTNSADAFCLRYSVLQLLIAANPMSEATKQAAHEMWNYLKGINVVFGVRDAKPNVYCYHCPVKVDPWTKRCRRRYDSGVGILEQHVGVRLQPYFEEDFHHSVHVPDAQEAWSSALDHVGSSRLAFI